MLHLIDTIEKDRQIIDAKMSTILSQIKDLQREYKSLEKTRENLTYAINQLEGCKNEQTRF